MGTVSAYQLQNKTQTYVYKCLNIKIYAFLNHHNTHMDLCAHYFLHHSFGLWKTTFHFHQFIPIHCKKKEHKETRQSTKLQHLELWCSNLYTTMSEIDNGHEHYSFMESFIFFFFNLCTIEIFFNIFLKFLQRTILTLTCGENDPLGGEKFLILPSQFFMFSAIITDNSLIETSSFHSLRYLLASPIFIFFFCWKFMSKEKGRRKAPKEWRWDTTDVGTSIGCTTHHAFFFCSIHQNSLLQQAHKAHQTLFHFQTNYYFPLVSLQKTH